MAKDNITQIVTKPVTVTKDPAVREIHRKLGGGSALAGSPAGSEAQPSLVREGFKMPPGGR